MLLTLLETYRSVGGSRIDARHLRLLECLLYLTLSGLMPSICRVRQEKHKRRTRTKWSVETRGGSNSRLLRQEEETRESVIQT